MEAEGDKFIFPFRWCSSTCAGAMMSIQLVAITLDIQTWKTGEREYESGWVIHHATMCAARHPRCVCDTPFP